jgi:secretory carrier-associated membrane protein
MVFFFIFFFQTLFTIFQAIGILGGGFCGFIMAIDQFNGSTGGILAGIFLLFIATGFAVCAAGNAMMLTKV